MRPVARPDGGKRGPLGRNALALGISVLLIAFHLAAAPVAAQEGTLTPRGGEHGAFTRLVMQLPARTGWSLRQRDQQAIVVFDPSPRDFDLSETFRRINHMRLRSISSATDQLVLDLGCDCTVTAEADSTGLLVIDIRGPAAVPAAARPTVRPPSRPARAPGQHEIARSVGQSVAQHHTALRQVPAEPASALWQNRLLQHTSQHSPDAPSDFAAEAPRQLTAEIEGALARQLARAAGRGIVSLRPTSTSAASVLLPARDTPASTIGAPDPVAEHLRLGNRAIEDFAAQQISAAPKTECPPDAWFDLAAWAGTGSFHEKAAQFRQSMSDGGAPDQITEFAKFYLHYGFGSEAALLLADADIDEGSGAVLLDLARIIDGKTAGEASALPTMAACENSAALWAFMAAPPDNLPRPNTNAVVRSFGELPDHLRRDLGPRLAQRFLEFADVEAAQLIQTAIERISQPADTEHALSAARIALETATATDQTTRAALDLLTPSSDSVLLQLEHALATQAQPDPGLIETGLAYASDLKGTPDGGRLYSLSIEGLARNGAYGDAFSTLFRLQASGVGFLSPGIEDVVWDVLAASAPDPAFVSTVFDQQPWRAPQRIRSSTRQLLADRLSDLGFFTHANALLPEVAAPRTPDENAGPPNPDGASEVRSGDAPSDADIGGLTNELPGTLAPTAPPDAPRALGNALLSESSALRENLAKLLGAE